jgi:hypothetical protein
MDIFTERQKLLARHAELHLEMQAIEKLLVGVNYVISKLPPPAPKSAPPAKETPDASAAAAVDPAPDRTA